MNLTNVANKAATDTSDAIGKSLSEGELEQVTAIIAKAMENAVLEASNQHTTACVNCVGTEKDLAHQLREEIERKKIALIANLSSLR
jgi:hypothetical protein